jgi:hypothetical protein
MIVARILAALVLAAFFVAGATFNHMVLWRALVSRRHGPSVIPFLPGVAGALALWVTPLPSLRPYAWVPLVVDYGCLPYLAGCSLYLGLDAWRHSRFNLVARYVAKVGDHRTATLSLYRKDFVLEQDIRRSPSEYGVTHIGTVGAWGETPHEIVLKVGEGQIVFRKEGKDLRQTQGYSECEGNPDLSLAEVLFHKVT